MRLRVLLALLLFLGGFLVGHDTPDWGGQYNAPQFYPLFDQGELAARLGSFVTYDRRGAVIWLTGFDDGLLPFESAVAGSGSLLALVSTPVDHPPFAAALHSGAVAGAVVDCYRVMAVPPNLRIGLASLARFNPHSDRFNQDIMFYDNTSSWQARLQVDLVNHTLGIKQVDGSYLTLASGLPDYTSSQAFNHVKLVADFDTHEYVRALFVDQEYDLAGNGLVQAADTSASRLLVRFTNRNDTGAASDIYVDNVIVTAVEP
jgi:hypothetical protein